MNEPADHERDDLEAGLPTVTDQEWRDAHERLLTDLADEQPDPDTAARVGEQMAYEWSPGHAAE